MFGGNDQPAPPPSAPLQKVETTPTETTTATTATDTSKVAGQLESNIAKPGALATPAGDTETNKSLLGT